MKQLKLNHQPRIEDGVWGTPEKVTPALPALWSVLYHICETRGSCILICSHMHHPRLFKTLKCYTAGQTPVVCLPFPVDEDGHQEFLFPPFHILAIYDRDTEISSIYWVIISTYACKALGQSKTHQAFPPSTGGIRLFNYSEVCWVGASSRTSVLTGSRTRQTLYSSHFHKKKMLQYLVLARNLSCLLEVSWVTMLSRQRKRFIVQYSLVLATHHEFRNELKMSTEVPLICWVCNDYKYHNVL